MCKGNHSLHCVQDVIADTLTKEIRSFTFAFCSSLSNINLPSSVKTIGEYAFYECASLKQIELPSSLEMLGNYVFYGCSQLKSLFIPKNVKNLGDWMFAKCESIPEAGFSFDYIAIYTKQNEEEEYEDFAKCITFTIDKVKNRRIETVKVVVRDATDEEIEEHKKQMEEEK